MKTILAAMLLTALTALSSGEEYTLDPAAWQSLKNTSERENALVAAGNVMLKSKEFYPVDPAKTYKLSATVKNSDGSTPAALYIGFIPCTADKTMITAVNMNAMPSVTGELAADCEAKDTVVKLKPDNAANWTAKLAGASLAFDAKADLSDLPNLKIARIKSLETKDGACLVTLLGPVGFKLAAGASVRIHTGGGSFMYPVLAGKPAPADWTTLSGTVKGMRDQGYAFNAWPKPAAFCQVVILANWDNPKSVIELKDVKLTVE